MTGGDHRVARSDGWDETSSLSDSDHDPREREGERESEKRREILGEVTRDLLFMFRSKGTKNGAFTVGEIPV